MTEFVWIMDSTNAKCPPKFPCNPTNDITVEPQLSVNRMEISAIELATCEFPRAQRLIENCWNRIYFFSGFRPTKHARSLRIEVCLKNTTESLTATLPRTLNRIIKIEKIGERDYVFQTKVPHELPTVGAQVIGLVQILEGPFEILSPTHFAARTTFDIKEETSRAIKLYSPPEASPASIAAKLTAQWNEAFRTFHLSSSFSESSSSSSEPVRVAKTAFADSFRRKTLGDERFGAFALQESFCTAPFLLEFDICRSRFVLNFSANANALRARLIIDDRSLDLGFNVGEHFLMREKPVVATYTPAGTTFITLTSGNYVIEEMLDEINQRFNAFFFLPGSIFTVSDAAGLHTIGIVPGSYSPQSLVNSINSSLIAFDIELIFEETCDGGGIFFFVSNHVFNLEFQTAELTNVPFKFGFRPTRYSGFKKYQSQDAISPQRTGPGKRFNVLLSDAQLNLDATTLSFFFSIPSSLATANLVREDEDYLRISNPAQALGAQVGDVVELGFGPNKFRFEVEEVINGTEFAVTVPPSFVLPNQMCSVELVIKPTVSIFMSLNNTQTIKPIILGFADRDVLFQVNENDVACVISTPFAFRMIPWTYVLMELTYPTNTSRVLQHRYYSDKKTTILAKILTSFEPEMEHYFPCRMTFFSATRLEYFNIRLLNSDHTLYELHGRPWTATFRLFCTQSPAGLLTGNYGEDRPARLQE